MNKSLEIKKHLLLGRSITQQLAIKLFKHYRLAVVIERLRKKDFNIKTDMIECEGCNYAKYTLIK